MDPAFALDSCRNGSSEVRSVLALGDMAGFFPEGCGYLQTVLKKWPTLPQLRQVCPWAGQFFLPPSC